VTSAKLGGTLDPAKFAPNSLTGAQIDESSLALPSPPPIAPDSLTGAQIDESTLQGVNAATTGGMEVKKINFQVPVNTGFQAILVYTGIFRIDAQCQTTGDRLDVAAFSGVNNSYISEIGMFNSDTGGGLGGANDTDVARDIVSRADNDFDANEGFEVDNTTEVTNETTVNVHFATPDGFNVTVDMALHYDGSKCIATGYSIGG
jgi:hypothetical protein